MKVAVWLIPHHSKTAGHLQGGDIRLGVYWPIHHNVIGIEEEFGAW